MKPITKIYEISLSSNEIEQTLNNNPPETFGIIVREFETTNEPKILAITKIFHPIWRYEIINEIQSGNFEYITTDCGVLTDYGIALVECVRKTIISEEEFYKDNLFKKIAHRQHNSEKRKV